MSRLVKMETGGDHEPMKKGKYKRENKTEKNLNVLKVEADNDHEAGRKKMLE